MTSRAYANLSMIALACLLSACGGGGGGSSSAPPAPQPAGSLQFSAATVTVDESAGTASVTITRTGGTGGAVSVTVGTSDLTALAGQDYTAVSNTAVTFADGDAAAKTVTVTIANDTAAEPDETLKLTLSAPTGGATLGANTSATFTIADNDPPRAAQLSVAGQLKQLRFTWPLASGATSYRVLRSPDGTAEFTPVSGSLASDQAQSTLDVGVHRRDWIHERYLLEACNGPRCARSADISALDVMLSTIGYFKASNAESFDNFGTAIALSADGSTLAVGAPIESSRGTDPADNGAVGSGAVYVFKRDGTRWSQQAYLKAAPVHDFDWFGFSLALSADGSTLAVGAIFDANSGTGVNGPIDELAPRSGAVYVFANSGTTWSQQAYVKPSNTNAGDEFCTALALSADGNTLAVGAPRKSDPFSQQGAAYVFTRTGTTWVEQAYLKASNPGGDDHFGSAVALSADGSTLAIGARFERSAARGVGGDPNDNTLFHAGAAYVLTRTGTAWSHRAYVKASNTEGEDEFGSAVALSADGRTLVVGAPGEDSSTRGNEQDNAGGNSGAAYVFVQGVAGWAQEAYVKSTISPAGQTFGARLVLSQDGNTLAVSALQDESTMRGVGDRGNGGAGDLSGAAFVFVRGTPGWSQQNYIKASNTAARQMFGSSIALSGDGDMLAVSAPTEDSAATGIGGNQDDVSADQAGAVYLY